MPSINEILENESQNNGSFILLYPEGMFYKAYERSAWLACMYLGNLLVKKRYIKKVQQDVVSVGFPKSSIEKWAGGRKIRTTDNYVMIILDDSEIQEYSDEIFHKWKDSGNESEEIYDRILSFPIENKTPMECMIFLSELKEKLNAKQ